MLLQVSVAALAGQTLVQPAAAPDTCPKGAKNCYSTASPSDSNKIAVWEWPKVSEQEAKSNTELDARRAQSTAAVNKSICLI